MTEPIRVEPMDQFNQALVNDVHPHDWVNPTPEAKYNLVVIGAGSGGLVTALGAAGLGAKVALVERYLLGGDCLNVGCVPSKCLLRSARQVDLARRDGEFGVGDGGGTGDFAAIMERMRRLRSEISPNDSARRLTEAGVDVYFGQAEFIDARIVRVDGRDLTFAKAVIATGARPVALPIEGLDEVGYHTNETIFTLTELPARLAIVGAGPIGCEMAQAFRRFGSEVTMIDKSTHLLPREDTDAAALLLETFEREGIVYLPNCDLQRAARVDGVKTLFMDVEGVERQVAADEILLGVGRAPNVEGLGLQRVDVDYDTHRGITVDDRLRTTNKRIYAVGDCCSRYKFTHASDAMARMVIANALFGGRKKVSDLIIPWCTYIDPEIAHVGLYPRQAKADRIKIDTYTHPFAEVDRAVVDGETAGFVKVHTAAGTDRILGATIVAAHAGDMISQITQAMVARIGLAKLGNVIFPYPTQAEAIRRVADAYNRTRLTPTVAKLFSRWLRWQRRPRGGGRR